MTATATYGTIDNLTFGYTGNQLLYITDAGPNVNLGTSADFKDYSKVTTAEYTFNKNGAMTKDLNKGISSVAYNSLNLPLTMDIKSPVAEARNEYTYTATGAKLKVVKKWNPNYSTTPVIGTTINTSLLTLSETTDYIGNKIYENGILKRILTDNGYIEGNTYYFYIKDHLGNNRVVANASGGAIQSTQYYPFGMAFAEGTTTEQGKQPYKYNGKELDQSHGLNQYDYSARLLDNAYGRFTTMDPHGENYYSWSPYVYVGNNPMKLTDPTGMDWYEAENGNVTWRRSQDKEYKDEDGNVYKNIGTEYLYVSKNKATLFQQGTNDNGELTLSSTSYDIKDEKTAKLEADKEVVRSWQSSDASRSAQQKYWDNPTMGNWLKYCLTEVISQYTDPYKVVGGLSAGVAGLSAMSSRAFFGRTPNQVYHTFRHIDELGISRPAVRSAVQSDLNAISSSMQTGQAINRTVVVGGQKLQYTVFRLPDGNLNIGRIHATK